MPKESSLLGGLAELKFVQKALSKGLTPFKPVIENLKDFDYLIEDAGRYHRVQVKKTWLREVSDYTGYTCGNLRKYRDRDCYDYVALVCFELDKIWLIPADVVGNRGCISIAASKLAEWAEYEF